MPGPSPTLIPHAWLPATASAVCASVRERSDRCLAAYRENPELIEEHANIERSITEGGYGRRQIYELVQNGADALLEAGARGRVHVLLTREALYCANQGAPITTEGVGAMLGAYVSRKRGREIGRFGLGFKSVLSVSRDPQFYSRSGSFVFSEAQAMEEIRRVHGAVEAAPVLRTAFPVDPDPAFAEDPDLAGLAEWASTVVKLPRQPDGPVELSEDLRDFPAQFLLFCPHVETVTFEDREEGTERSITLAREGDVLILRDGETETSWRVFDTLHRPSERAKRDAGELAGRDELLLSWAVQLGGRRERGRFWAYFPTEDATTLSGIANAPWKTNEDRQSLLVGTFNDELLKAFAKLVAESLPHLRETDDPASFLDLLPARGREADRWADEWMTIYVYQAAARMPCLPDQAGRLRKPKELSMHPPGLLAESLDLWAASPSRPEDWCHASTERRDRRSRVERLMELGGGVVEGIEDWLQALIPEPEPTSSARAVKLAALLASTAKDRQVAEAVRRASIVLTADGRVVAPDPRRVFISTGHEPTIAGLSFVHHEVVAVEGLPDALASLGITRLDAEEELRTLLDGTDERIDWESVWRLVDDMPAERAIEAFAQASVNPRAKTEAGPFAPLHEVLLPGDSVHPGEAPEVTVDTRFHAKTLNVLRNLGTVASPTGDGGGFDEPWFGEYEAWAVAEVRKEHPNRRGVKLERLAFPGPLAPLARLKGEAGARFTASLLELVKPTPRWRVVAGGVSVEVENPGWWFLRRHGHLHTSCGVWPVASCVGPGVGRWRRFLPVADLEPETARRLGLADGPQALDRQDWVRAFLRASRIDDLADVAAFYAFAAAYTGPPGQVRCRAGGERSALAPVTDVTVTVTRAETEALVRMGTPCIRAPDAETAETLVQEWGMRAAETQIRRQIFHIASAAPRPLLDVYPALRRHLPEESRGLELQLCSELSRHLLTAVGRTEESVELVVHDGVVYASDGLPERDVLVRLGAELGVPISEEIAADILERRATGLRRKRVEAARRAADDADRLLALVDEPTLRARLPEGLVESLGDGGGRVEPRRIAEMALAVHGVEVLRELRSDLEEKGLEPPRQWAGSQQAIGFVRELGFAPEYAGTPGSRRDPYLDIERPPVLPELHGFQRRIADRMKAVLRRDPEPRGLLAMPTGSGKTRVAVQAVVEHLTEGPDTATILWVAQTDELCEQAVQTWAYVWREIGPRSRPMRISRLWSANEAEPFDEGAHIVVATIQKLGGVVDKASYDWLSRADAVVIDEAHGSTERSYTKLLHWLGNRPGRTRCPLVGLTATPFRGMNAEETERLAARYGRHRIDHGVLDDDPYPQLQEMGVLARARHEVLDGVPLAMTDEEAEHVRRLSRLPPSVGDRLGHHADRNRRIVESISSLPDDWTVLLFATSVSHAQTIAGLLTAAGVPARPVWGETDAGARRRYVEDFRAGRLRVLTNYGVFTEGFDAPAVRAIYITRPTFSPNLYQQMIGRGLRGPLNGGKDECLVVDVADNVDRWNLKLAFLDFEYLWTREGRPVGTS